MAPAKSTQIYLLKRWLIAGVSLFSEGTPPNWSERDQQSKNKSPHADHLSLITPPIRRIATTPIAPVIRAG